MLLTEMAVMARGAYTASSATTETTGLNDVLNEIIWMRSISDIVKTLIAAGAAAVIVVVLLAVLQCFFGYRIFRYEMALIGAVGCGAAMYVGGIFLLHYSGGKLIAVTIAAAVLGAGMLFSVSAILVFLISLLTTTVALMVASSKNGWGLLPEMIIVISVATALICTILYKHAIIIGNVFLGAGTLGMIVAGLFQSQVFGWVVGGVFGVLGLFCQYWMLVRSNRKRKEQEEREEAEWRRKQQRKQQAAKQDSILQGEDEQTDVMQAIRAKRMDREHSLKETDQMNHEAENHENVLSDTERPVLHDGGFASRLNISETGTISTQEVNSKLNQ